MGARVHKSVRFFSGILLITTGLLGFMGGERPASAALAFQLVQQNDALRDARKFASEGRKAFQEKNWEKALEAFNASLRLHAQQPYILNARGVTYLNLQRLDSAISDFKACIQQLPENALPYFNLGNAYRLQKKLPEAIDAYSRAISLNAVYTAAYNNRGISYSELKKYDRALLDYNQSLKLNPRDLDVRNNRGYLYLLQKEYVKALQDFNAVLRKNPKHALAYGNKAQVLYQQGQCEAAAQLLDTSCELGNVKACRAARRISCEEKKPEPSASPSEK